MGRLFSFNGRTSRLGFWRAWLLCAVIQAAVVGVGYFVMIEISQLGVVILLGLAPPFVITLATTLRRLHDRDKTIGSLALFLLGPFAAFAVGQPLLEQDAVVIKLMGLPFTLIGLALSAWGWIEIGLLPGAPKANRFGDPPQPGR